MCAINHMHSHTHAQTRILSIYSPIAHTFLGFVVRAFWQTMTATFREPPAKMSPVKARHNTTHSRVVMPFSPSRILVNSLRVISQCQRSAVWSSARGTMQNGCPLVWHQAMKSRKTHTHSQCHIIYISKNERILYIHKNIDDNCFNSCSLNKLVQFELKFDWKYTSH